MSFSAIYPTRKPKKTILIYVGHQFCALHFRGYAAVRKPSKSGLRIQLEEECAGRDLNPGHRLASKSKVTNGYQPSYGRPGF